MIWLMIGGFVVKVLLLVIDAFCARWLDLAGYFLIRNVLRNCTLKKLLRKRAVGVEYKRENEEENIYEKQINDAGECEFYFIGKSPVFHSAVGYNQ